MVTGDGEGGGWDGLAFSSSKEENCCYTSGMHHAFIQRCLELAVNGRGKVSPNPLVGCVIGRGETIIAEAWHGKFGERHAEKTAIELVGARHALPLQEATLYVNLEPCCTKGKQPPCTDAIITSGIKTVVFGARDPSNPGAGRLKEAGIEVVGPVMEAECRRLNRGFFSLIEQGRPWVTVKKAMRRDGSIDGKITSEEQDAWSHQHLRAMHDAILVGVGTVIKDDPKLTIRHSEQAQRCASTPPSANASGSAQHDTSGAVSKRLAPRRIILDPHHEVPQTATVLTDEDCDRTLVISEKLPIPKLLQRLKEEGVASVLVEGGPGIWKSFEESDCIDETVVLVG
jgi:diaminohydroxyphosphoribosylaminopyrimidine deaminase / 5-amino-6-(5-phosphoribosylamino)uracil reductase